MPDPDRIQMLDLRPELEQVGDEVMAAVADVVRSGRFILGPVVAAFEAEAADHLGCAHAVGVNSGTDALALALRAAGVGPGDEVVTSGFSFLATAEAIAMTGARPVFADIDPATFLVGPAQVERRLSPRTRAVVPVHLYGQVAPVTDILGLVAARGVAVVEDAAQAFGASAEEGSGRMAGTLGLAGAFSFFPSKPLGGFGDGGLIVTDDADLAGACRRLRAHGSTDKADTDVVGCNSRLDAIQAAVLRVKLGRVAGPGAGRRRVAARYEAALAGVDGLVAPGHGPGSAVHLYTVRVLEGRRGEVRAALDRAGIESQVRYPVPLHRVRAYAEPDVTLPHAEAAAREVLSLPLWPAMADDVVDRVAGVVREALLGRAAGTVG